MLNTSLRHEAVATLLNERRSAGDDRRAIALATLAADAAPQRRRRLRCAVLRSRPAACPHLACECATAAI
jgi:hypothetical protein